MQVRELLVGDFGTGLRGSQAHVKRQRNAFASEFNEGGRSVLEATVPYHSTLYLVILCTSMA